MKRQHFRIILLPFSFIYGIIISIRNTLFDFDIIKSKEFDIPIISVGNLCVGGTGKTPHVEYLIKHLKEEFKIVTLSRGYKRKSKGFVKADEKSTYLDIGDEPKQIKDKFPETTVAVSKNRLSAVNYFINDKKHDDLNLVLLDDAYQYRYIKPGISILLIDFNRPVTKDFLLPAGNLRERSYRKKRANIIIISKSPKDLTPIQRRIMEKEINVFPYQSLYFTTIDYLEPKALFSNKQTDFAEKDILLVTGIAKSTNLENYIKKKSKSLSTLKFSDHHNYKQKDIENIKNSFEKINSSNKIIITTEKDAVRLKDCKFADIIKNLPIFYIPIEIRFLDEKNEQKFIKQIKNYVRTNKRNFKFHFE